MAPAGVAPAGVAPPVAPAGVAPPVAPALRNEGTRHRDAANQRHRRGDPAYTHRDPDLILRLKGLRTCRSRCVVRPDDGPLETDLRARRWLRAARHDWKIP